MKIILSRDVDKLGAAGDVVIVKDGYARNYLIPAGFALKADKAGLKTIEAQRKASQLRAIREMKTHTAIAQRLSMLELITKVQVGEENRMFGAVTSADIAELIAQKGVEIDRRIIDLPEPIKSLGVHIVPIKLHADVVARVKVRVEAADREQ